MARTDLLGCLCHSRNISGRPGGNVVTSGININFELRMNSLKFTHFFWTKVTLIYQNEISAKTQECLH